MREIKMYRDLFKIKELDSNLRFFLSVLISLAEPKLNNKCIIENSNYHQLKKYFIIVRIKTDHSTSPRLGELEHL